MSTCFTSSNRQYCSYWENVCVQRMMVIVWGRNFLEAIHLIILIATARLANIRKRNTWFLYKKQFLSKLSIKESCIIFFWLKWWRFVLYMDAVTIGGNQTRLLWWTMLENSDGTVLNIKTTYWNGRSYWIEEVICCRL